MDNLRQYTNKLLDLVEDGYLKSDDVMKACLDYMSEAQVEDMATSEGFVDEDEVENEA